MAKSDCFLKFEGIDAESEDAALPGWIQVSSWDWKASTGDSGGQKAARASASSFVIKHAADRSSAALMSTCVTNKLIKKGTLIQRRAGGSAPQTFIKIEFKNVRLASVTYSHGESGFPEEAVEFTFESIMFDYTPQSETGGNKSGAASVTWDISQK